MRTSRSPMTANGEVQTREEATVHVKHLDLFDKVVLLEETPAVLSSEKVCEDTMGIHTTGPAARNHISTRVARELIAQNQIRCHSQSLVYQRVPLQLPHLHHHHLHHGIPCLMSADTPKIQYQEEVEARVKSFGEKRCKNPQKPKTKIKVVNQKKYKEIYRMNCLIGYRKRIWLMKVLQRSLGKPRARKSRHFQFFS